MQKKNSPSAEDWQILPTQLPDLKLTGEAKREYERIGPYLTAIDRVTELDRQALTQYCVQWASFVSKAKRLKGALTADGTNHVVSHPLLAPTIRSSRSIFKVAGLFGLTARTRDLEGDHGNRKSRALKKLQGNRSKVGEHHLESPTTLAMPDWKPADVDAPEWLSRRAQSEYNRLRECLENADMFCPLDLVPITVICVLFDIYCSAYEQIDTLTVEVYDKEGEVTREIEHPLHKAMTDISELLTYMWKDYGQTPRFRKIFDGENKKEEQSVPIIFKPKFA